MRRASVPSTNWEPNIGASPSTTTRPLPKPNARPWKRPTAGHRPGRVHRPTWCRPSRRASGVVSRRASGVKGTSQAEGLSTSRPALPGGPSQRLAGEGRHPVDALALVPPARDRVVAQQALGAREEDAAQVPGLGVHAARVHRVALAHVHAEADGEAVHRRGVGRVVGDQEQRATLPHPVAHHVALGDPEGGFARAAGPFGPRAPSASATTSTWQVLSSWGENACPPGITRRPSCESRLAKAAVEPLPGEVVPVGLVDHHDRLAVR